MNSKENYQLRSTDTTHENEQGMRNTSCGVPTAWLRNVRACSMISQQDGQQPNR